MTIAVRPMDADEADAFLARSRQEFVVELARNASLDADEADRRAREIQAEALPDGPRTAGHAFLMIQRDGRSVGTLWLGPHRQRADAAFIWDIAIDESERGHGIGHAALEAADNWARTQGFVAIGLNVFGSNPRARRLYEETGYEVVATDMLKRLDR